MIARRKTSARFFKSFVLLMYFSGLIFLTFFFRHRFRMDCFEIYIFFFFFRCQTSGIRKRSFRWWLLFMLFFIKILSTFIKHNIVLFFQIFIYFFFWFFIFHNKRCMNFINILFIHLKFFQIKFINLNQFYHS